jgi:MoxR-like ATPase
MADLLLIPADIRARLSPVAEGALEQAGRLAVGNGRSLVSAEDIIVSLLMDGTDEPDFAALLGRAGLDVTELAKEILRLGRIRTVKDPGAPARLTVFWAELGGTDPGAPLDCARLLGTLLDSEYMPALTGRLLIENGLSADSAFEAAWPPTAGPSRSQASPYGPPPFGRLLPDEAAHISGGRERLCQRLAGEYRDGHSLLVYGPPGVGKHFLARQIALASGRLTVELKGTDLVGLIVRERGLRLAELTAYLEAAGGGLLLADADDPRLHGQLPLSANTPLLVTAHLPRLALRITPGRRLARRRVPPIARDALLRTLSARQGKTGEPKMAASDMAAAVDLAHSFFPSTMAMPGAAIDLIHIAEKRRQQERATGPIGRDSLEEAVQYLTYLPRALVSKDERERLVSLESRLGEQIVGQRPAISAVCGAIIRHELSLVESKRPVGSFVFVGPTGVGKTELANALALSFYGTPSALVRFDMAEFQQDHEISKFIGSPPGYVGSDKDGQLIAALKKRRRIVLLLDEIEKAHPRVYDFLLGLLDYGVVTSGKGEKVSLREAVVIMTTNIGAGAKSLGFLGAGDTLDSRASAARTSAVRAHFASRPEFVNRLDGIIEFSALSPSELDAVLGIRLGAYTLAHERAGIHLELGPALRARMVAEAAASGLGGRELTTRQFNTEIEDRVTEALLHGAYTRGMTMKIELDEAGFGQLVCLPPQAKSRRLAH